MPALHHRPHRTRTALAPLRVLALAGLLLASLWAGARDLPQRAQFGTLSRFAYPSVTVAGKTLRMAPGARIYDEQNLIIMPAAMRQSAQVLYRLDTAGEVAAIWILTPDEARGRASKPSSPTSSGTAAPAGAAR